MWKCRVLPSPTDPTGTSSQQGSLRGANLAGQMNCHVAIPALAFEEAHNDVTIVKTFHLLHGIKHHVVGVGLDEGVGVWQSALTAVPLFLRAGVLGFLQR